MQDETKSVQSFGKTKLPPRNNCGRPQLHPPVCEASISSSIIQPGPEYKRWARGPANSAGCVVNLSDRPSLCMSLMGGQAAIGSSDHAVYTVDVPSGKFRKALYGGRKGHTEWVTCITHLPDGRILSGGMDSKLCLWDRAGSSCIDLLAHTASISNVKVPSNGFLALSSSYDKSILLWDLTPHKGYKPSSKPIASLRGHKAPVMAIAVSSICTQNSLNKLASGCRDGSVILWDACTASIVLDHKQAHTGHVTALECLGCADGSGPDIFLSGGQDGILQVWDVRARYPVHKDVLHSSAKGQGALSCICVSQHSACGCPMIVTGGADKVMKVVDPRFSFQVVHTLNDHRDFIYSLFASVQGLWYGVEVATGLSWSMTLQMASVCMVWELQQMELYAA
ncbi:hypothetical protein KP509_14G073800 [Ceratopteris richardii]|uniref:Uncharacterized protein n=1 Tax=Ceratopteris richardii TaxID=49495 RepID=A0A8T2TAU2_CERRI|nr:hypothetical protein KP509_14G073800 [Ceratopteris richardii]